MGAKTGGDPSAGGGCPHGAKEPVGRDHGCGMGNGSRAASTGVFGGGRGSDRAWEFRLQTPGPVPTGEIATAARPPRED